MNLGNILKVVSLHWPGSLQYTGNQVHDILTCDDETELWFVKEFYSLPQVERSLFVKKCREQRNNAKRRGHVWKLTVLDFFRIWRFSGRWEQRGRQRGDYCMSRIGDMGAYEVNNVFIQPVVDNCEQATRARHAVNGGGRLKKVAS